jgi:hypothetical protein
MDVEVLHVASEPEAVKSFTQVGRLQSFGTAVKNLAPSLRTALIAFAVK